MKRQTIITLTAIVAIVVVAMFAGCTEETSETATPAGQVEQVIGDSQQTNILARAVTGSVMTFPKNWDADADNDGIIVYPNLEDSSGETVKFKGIKLPVKIEIYTTKLTKDYKEVKDRLVYSGTATIDSWEDGNFIFDGGIKVPFENIKAAGSDSDYGWVYAAVSLPDGRTIEGVEKYARIKQE
jgi:hypothetical protein